MATAAAVKDEAAAHRFAKDHLKAFVERVERLEEEKKALSDDIRDVYAEAKANGFDVKALRTIVRLRKQDIDERKEQEAILETYLQALGMLDYAPDERPVRSSPREGSRAQACDFASDAVIRTTLPAPAKGDDRGHSATGGPLECPSKVAKQPGEPEAGVIESGSASAPRSPYSLAPADPDADEGARAVDHAPCPATIQLRTPPAPLAQATGNAGSTGASKRGRADDRMLTVGAASTHSPSSSQHDGKPGDDDAPRPERINTIPDTPGGAADLDPEFPPFLRRGPDNRSPFLPPPGEPPPSTGPP